MRIVTRCTRRIARLFASAPVDLRGQIAIVTGASAGIGAATALALARRGATVVLAARRARRLERQAALIARRGGHAMAVVTDVTDARQIARLAHEVSSKYGRIDILVNCAGIGMSGPITRMSMDHIHAQFATNLIGPILLSRAVLPGMIARRHGTVISVASIAGYVAIDPLYSATKFGLRGYSLALARHVRGTGVSVSLLSPGHIRTAMTRGMKKHRPGPDYVADEILALVQNPRRERIIPRGYHLDVWLDRVLPWLMEALLRRRMGEAHGIENCLLDIDRVTRVDHTT